MHNLRAQHLARAAELELSSAAHLTAARVLTARPSPATLDAVTYSAQDLQWFRRPVVR